MGWRSFEVTATERPKYFLPEKDEILYAGSYQSVFICFGKFWAKGQRPKVCQIDFDHNWGSLQCFCIILCSKNYDYRRFVLWGCLTKLRIASWEASKKRTCVLTQKETLFWHFSLEYWKKKKNMPASINATETNYSICK